MDEKALIWSLINFCEMSQELSETLDQHAGTAERLNAYLYQLLKQVNPVESNDWDEDETWDKYKDKTIKYLNGGK